MKKVSRAGPSTSGPALPLAEPSLQPSNFLRAERRVWGIAVVNTLGVAVSLIDAVDQRLELQTDIRIRLGEGDWHRREGLAEVGRPDQAGVGLVRPGDRQRVRA